MCISKMVHMYFAILVASTVTLSITNFENSLCFKFVVVLIKCAFLIFNYICY